MCLLAGFANCKNKETRLAAISFIETACPVFWMRGLPDEAIMSMTPETARDCVMRAAQTSGIKIVRLKGKLFKKMTLLVGDTDFLTRLFAAEFAAGRPVVQVPVELRQRFSVLQLAVMAKAGNVLPAWLANDVAARAQAISGGRAIKELATELGIKTAGKGWHMCCPPNGNAADVAAAVQRFCGRSDAEQASPGSSLPVGSEARKRKLIEERKHKIAAGTLEPGKYGKKLEKRTTATASPRPANGKVYTLDELQALLDADVALEKKEGASGIAVARINQLVATSDQLGHGLPAGFGGTDCALRKHHAKRFYCSACPSRFMTSSSAGLHERGHEKNFACSFCDRRFSQKAHAIGHEQKCPRQKKEKD